MDPKKKAIVLKYISSIFSEKGDFNKAIPKLEEGLKLNPEDSNIYIELAKIYVKQNDWKKAKENFKLAEARLPNDPSVLYHVANAHIELGELESAKQYLGKLVKEKQKFSSLAVRYKFELEKQQKSLAIPDDSSSLISSSTKIPEKAKKTPKEIYDAFIDLDKIFQELFKNPILNAKEIIRRIEKFESDYCQIAKLSEEPGSLINLKLKPEYFAVISLLAVAQLIVNGSAEASKILEKLPKIFAHLKYELYDVYADLCYHIDEQQEFEKYAYKVLKQGKFFDYGTCKNLVIFYLNTKEYNKVKEVLTKALTLKLEPAQKTICKIYMFLADGMLSKDKKYLQNLKEFENTIDLIKEDKLPEINKQQFGIIEAFLHAYTNLNDKEKVITTLSKLESVKGLNKDTKIHYKIEKIEHMILLDKSYSLAQYREWLEYLYNETEECSDKRYCLVIALQVLQCAYEEAKELDEDGNEFLDQIKFIIEQLLTCYEHIDHHGSIEIIIKLSERYCNSVHVKEIGEYFIANFLKSDESFSVAKCLNRTYLLDDTDENRFTRVHNLAKRMCDIFPDNPETYINLAYTKLVMRSDSNQQKQTYYLEAIKCLEKALKAFYKNPNYLNLPENFENKIYDLLGICYCNTQKYQAAAEAFAKGIQGKSGGNYKHAYLLTLQEEAQVRFAKEHHLIEELNSQPSSLSSSQDKEYIKRYLDRESQRIETEEKSEAISYLTRGAYLDKEKQKEAPNKQDKEIGAGIFVRLVCKDNIPETQQRKFVDSLERGLEQDPKKNGIHQHSDGRLYLKINGEGSRVFESRCVKGANMDSSSNNEEQKEPSFWELHILSDYQARAETHKR